MKTIHRLVALALIALLGIAAQAHDKNAPLDNDSLHNLHGRVIPHSEVAPAGAI